MYAMHTHIHLRVTFRQYQRKVWWLPTVPLSPLVNSKGKKNACCWHFLWRKSWPSLLMFLVPRAFLLDRGREWHFSVIKSSYSLSRKISFYHPPCQPNTIQCSWLLTAGLGSDVWGNEWTGDEIRAWRCLFEELFTEVSNSFWLIQKIPGSGVFLW